MAKLKKLQLSGIRSFGPFEEHVQQLIFESPVTLILGLNGSGKTTIIESIKYACTGDLPDGSNNGQGFVNDPKMSKSASTKGQIKLKILGPGDNQITVSRVVEVVQKSQKLQFTTKNAIIRTVTPQGKDTSVSNRCADVTAECCQVMNISRAVLNNVVFCHQENSTWPLDEAKKLKDKFDEIFDADKYSKCIDYMRKVAKEKQNNLKIIQVELEHRKYRKKQVDTDKQNLEDKENLLVTLESDIDNKNIQLNPIRTRMDEIFELEIRLGELERDLAGKEATKQALAEEQVTIKKGLMFEFEGSDYELREKIRSFQTDRDEDERLIGELETKKSQIESKSKKIGEFIEKTRTQQGQLAQERNQHERKCLERKSLWGLAAQTVGMELSSDVNTNEEAKSSLQRFETKIEENEKSLQSLINEKDQEEVTLQKEVDEAREKCLSTKHKKETKAAEVKQCERKIEETEAELRNISSSDEYLKRISQKIENIDKTIFNLNNTFRETEESQRAEDLKKEILDIDHELDALETDYRLLQQNDSTEGKIDSKRHLIMEKEREINRIKTKHADSFKQLFGSNIPEINLKDTLVALQKTSEATVKDLNDQIAKKQKEVTTLDVQRQNQQEKISMSEKELKTKKTKIAEVCKGRDFNEILESTYQKKERLQVDKGQYNSVKIIYGQFIKKFEEKIPCCPVCETNFADKHFQVKKIVATLKSKLESVPRELTRVENELHKEETLYSKLQQLKLVNEETQTLYADHIPQLNRQLEATQERFMNAFSELEELKLQLSAPQKLLDLSKSVISDVASLDQNRFDLNKSRKEVESLQLELVQVASNKSKAEVEAQIDYLKSEVFEKRRQVDGQTKKIASHKERLQRSTLERSQLVQEQMNLTKSIQSKPVLELQLAEMKEKIEALKDEVNELEAATRISEAELNAAIENKNRAVSKNKQFIQEARQKNAASIRIFQEIKKLQNEIDYYLREGVDEQLESLKAKMNEYKSKENHLQETKVKVLDAIAEKREELAKQELKFKTFQSNELLREKKRKAETLNEEIGRLRHQIGEQNYRTVYEEKRQLESENERLKKEINTLLGERNTLIVTLDEIRSELNKPESKSANDLYLDKFYELKVVEQVIRDLNNYVQCLEMAVVDFHKQKMTQINKTIREMWRDIYRGNDIDYIEIKTEHTTMGANKRRTYNYKVVQVKRGIELDMRGRCSAGQKVLACIIIRMALSEILSSNCGILTLDEPTTNLDKANVQSLADALCRIIQNREREKNFQLVIITHDEEFLRILTRVQGVSHFFRVTRDHEGFSVIKKEYTL